MLPADLDQFGGVGLEPFVLKHRDDQSKNQTKTASLPSSDRFQKLDQNSQFAQF